MEDCWDGCCCGGLGAFLSRRPRKNITKSGVHQMVRERLIENAPKGASGVELRKLLLCSDPTRQLTKSYKVEESVGGGAFGTVFKATHIHTGEERAIKQIPKTDVQDDMQFIYTELEAMINLDHPNVVKFYEFFEDQKQLYLVTELITGGDFSDISRNSDDPEEIRTLFRDLVLAVMYCHDYGVAHRDLKFENCLIHKVPQQRRVAKVIDFGLSAIRRSGDKVGQWLNDQLGTRYFVAPEVIDSNKQYGVKCDCWSVGVMLYIVLTDEHPCADGAHNMDTTDLFRKVLSGRIRTKPLDTDEVEESARDFILKLLVKDPDHRMDARSALDHRWLRPGGKDTGPSKSRRALVSWKSESAMVMRPTNSRRQSQPSTPLDRKVVKRITEFGSYSRFEKAVMTLVAHQATEREVEDLRTTFMELDTSSTGTLSKDEIRAGIKECGYDMTDADVDQIFLSLDADGTGKVQYTEWLAATMKPSLLATDKVVRQLYSFFDIEGNGKVTRDELLHVLGCDQSVSAVLARGDQAGDDCLSEAEFKALMTDIAKDLESRSA